MDEVAFAKTPKVSRIIEMGPLCSNKPRAMPQTANKIGGEMKKLRSKAVSSVTNGNAQRK